MKLSWYNRRYIIDPKAQFKIVFFLGMIAVIFAVIICGAAYTQINRLGILFNNSMIPPAALPEAFKMIADKLMYSLALIVMTMVIVFSIAGILLTHRLAGPIWKLQMEIKKFLNGEQIRPIAFRRGDEFKDLPPLVNKLMEGYKERQ